MVEGENIAQTLRQDQIRETFYVAVCKCYKD
jgi:hypothetical protein